MEPDITKLSAEEIATINNWNLEDQFSFYNLYNNAIHNMSETQRIYFIKVLLLASISRQLMLEDLMKERVLGGQSFLLY